MFALTAIGQINLNDALLIFIILHLLVYPSSNGYNSYMDRDKGSIGGLKNPLSPTPQLLYVTFLLDIVAILLSLLVSWIFSIGILAYILASRAYSARNIRLKKYPVAGYLTVIIFQGALSWYIVYHGASDDKSIHAPVTGVIAAMLLIGGFYPLTQIYQHEADKQDGVKTISMLLGY
ncbi:MAG: UbiA family prenyltransferase, partial [Flavitalea sp.]